MCVGPHCQCAALEKHLQSSNANTETNQMSIWISGLLGAEGSKSQFQFGPMGSSDWNYFSTLPIATDSTELPKQKGYVSQRMRAREPSRCVILEMTNSGAFGGLEDPKPDKNETNKNTRSSFSPQTHLQKQLTTHLQKTKQKNTLLDGQKYRVLIGQPLPTK